MTDGLVKGSGSHTGPYAERTPHGPRRICTISGPGLGKRQLENSNLGVRMSKMLSSEGPTLWAGIPFLSPLVRSLCHTGHTHSDGTFIPEAELRAKLLSDPRSDTEASLDFVFRFGKSIFQSCWSFLASSFTIFVSGHCLSVTQLTESLGYGFLV